MALPFPASSNAYLLEPYYMYTGDYEISEQFLLACAWADGYGMGKKVRLFMSEFGKIMCKVTFSPFLGLPLTIVSATPRNQG